MKAGTAAFFASSLTAFILIATFPSSGRSSFAINPVSTIAFAASDPSPSQPDTATDWQQSADEAVRNAEVAAEKAYNRAAHGVRDVSLEGRVMAVLHENKSTRDADVQVTADNGIVILNGSVASEQAAKRVQEIVASVYGVRGVTNELNFPGARKAVTPRDADSMGIAHPAYSDTAPAEKAPGH